MKGYRVLFIAGLLSVLPGYVIVAQQDSVSTVAKVRKELHLDPVKATMLSAAFPGFGQIYNRKFWKIPFVYAGFGGVGYAVFYNTKYFNKYTKAYQDFTDLIPETASYTELIRGIEPDSYDPVLFPDTYNPSTASWIKDQLLGKVDYYRKYRDLSFIGVAVWYLVSILDANVDASLSEFEVSDNLDITLAPFQIPLYNFTAVGINLTMKLNF
jgi:hypothetical protein